MTEEDMNVKNTLFQVLESFGFKLNRSYPLPIQKHVLNEMDMTAHRFSSLVYGSADMTLNEAKSIAEWLGIPPAVLVEDECPKKLHVIRTIYVTPKSEG